MDAQEGFVLGIDKPLRWTSFDVVNKVRWQLCKRLGVKKLKVGHAGTLDPLATGVMLVCVGRATKRIDELQAHTKEYVATIQLGATTPSFDLEHPIDALYPTAHITRQLVEQTLPRFLGTIEQVPPAYSAVKVDGHRAYDLARSSHAKPAAEVQPAAEAQPATQEPPAAAEAALGLKAKTLVIDEIELLSFSPTATDTSAAPSASVSAGVTDGSTGGASAEDPAPSAASAEDPAPSAAGPEGSAPPSVPREGMRRKLFLTAPAATPDARLAACPSFTIRVVCSKGTYIRALARDIGQALGSGAHLTALRRTRVGDVAIGQCVTMDALSAWLDAHGFPPLPSQPTTTNTIPS